MRKPNNLGKHELIGLNVQVYKGDLTDEQVTRGRIVDETMNTFVIESESKEKRIPKHGHTFHIELDDTVVRINGDRIRFRPEDRTKKVKRLG